VAGEGEEERGALRHPAGERRHADAVPGEPLPRGLPRLGDGGEDDPVLADDALALR
jgi:hypothetical protein